jgi:predicted DsbA family dithiol-disulfide isomerase
MNESIVVMNDIMCLECYYGVYMFYEILIKLSEQLF